jgi:hypothetical protein
VPTDVTCLDDRSAVGILARIARSLSRSETEELSLTPEIRSVLAKRFHVPPEMAAVSEGNLARQALLLLSEDPVTREAIETIAARQLETPEKFDAGMTIALTTAVLFALQTRVRFERDKQGTWSLTIEKKPTSDALLKGLVQKLLSFSPKDL